MSLHFDRISPTGWLVFSVVVDSVKGELLTLGNIHRSDMGAYLCIAKNDIPPTVSKRFMVEVHCKSYKKTESFFKSITTINRKSKSG